MSIEKLSDDSRTKLQATPFTQIANEVIEHIKDNDAFRIFAYLSSKSRDWKVIKSHIQTICRVGQRKMRDIFSYFLRAKLIKYDQIIGDDGKFIRTDIVVLNGLDFDKNMPFLARDVQNDSKIELSTEQDAGGAETARAENRPRGNDQLPNKEKALKKEKQNRRYVSENLKYEKPTPSSYVEQQTVSDEWKTAKRGDVKTAEYYLSNMPGIPKLNRYKVR